LVACHGDIFSHSCHAELADSELDENFFRPATVPRCRVQGAAKKVASKSFLLFSQQPFGILI